MNTLVASKRSLALASALMVLTITPAQATGPEEGFEDPAGGEEWAPNPNGPGNGWLDSDGNVWVPTGHGGRAHGGPHWDVQQPRGGGYVNVYPGGTRR